MTSIASPTAGGPHLPAPRNNSLNSEPSGAARSAAFSSEETPGVNNPSGVRNQNERPSTQRPIVTTSITCTPSTTNYSTQSHATESIVASINENSSGRHHPSKPHQNLTPLADVTSVGEHQDPPMVNESVFPSSSDANTAAGLSTNTAEDIPSLNPLEEQSQSVPAEPDHPSTEQTRLSIPPSAAVDSSTTKSVTEETNGSEEKEQSRTESIPIPVVHSTTVETNLAQDTVSQLQLTSVENILPNPPSTMCLSPNDLNKNTSARRTESSPESKGSGESPSTQPPAPPTPPPTPSVATNHGTLLSSSSANNPPASFLNTPADTTSTNRIETSDKLLVVGPTKKHGMDNGDIYTSGETQGYPQPPPKKKRKRSKGSSSAASSTGRWTEAEHQAFLSGLATYGREWKRVALHIPTRTSAQVRSHAQKYFCKIQQQQQQQLQEQQQQDHNQLHQVDGKLGDGRSDDQAHITPSVRANVERILAQPATVQAEVEDTMERLRERYRQLQRRLQQQNHASGGSDSQSHTTLESLQDSELIALHVLQGGLPSHGSAASHESGGHGEDSRGPQEDGSDASDHTASSM